MTKRQILVTSALPYANGDIHLGHLYEYIQTDIWVRFQRSRGETCYYVCADDAHGTSIMLRAEKEKLTPEQWINQVKKTHEADFARFHISFDHYDSTHSSTNRELSELIYLRLREAGYINQREIKQMFDPVKQLFLADRFIKGTCPKCHSPDQYGDNCEVCGSTYTPMELIDPVSAISGATPVIKSSLHYFFRLPDFENFLHTWVQSGSVQPQIANKLHEWFESGLNEWDISRDAPYFGFEIPDAPHKYFYVWLDAPIGYLASFKNFCQENQIDFDDYWRADSTAEVHHFIGKDIVYFHALFWPAMLHGSGFRTPTSIHCHGFITINGSKMSKSRGTFIRAQDYAQFLEPEYLRFYFAAKINGKIDDIDLNLEELTARVNADLIGKIINIASRCAKLIEKLGNRLAPSLSDKALLEEAIVLGERIAEHYEKRDYASAMREIIKIADQANAYIAEKAPWVLIKQSDQKSAVLECCSLGINLFRQIMVYLAPVLPDLADRAQAFLNIQTLNWSSRHEILLDHPLHPFTPLMQRVDPDQINKMLAYTRQLST